MKNLFLCTLLFLTSSLRSQNLQATKLFQANSNSISKTITSSYLKGRENGDIYSNTIVSGDVNVFGKPINTGNNKVSVFSKLNSAGNLQWQSYITSSNIQPASYDDSHTIDLNNQGEIIYAIPTFNNSSFKSNSGIEIPLTNYGYEVIKLSNSGELQWKKSIISNANPKVYCFYDRSGDVIIWLGQNQGTSLLFDNQQINSAYSLLIKINGQTGDIIYTKNINHLDYWIASIVFDENNEMYAFYEPFNIDHNNIFNFGNIQVPGNDDDSNLLMIKFDISGTPIWGKNFYGNVPAGTNKYSWPINVKYDGTNFLIYAIIAGVSPNLSYLTIDGTYHNNPYQNKNLANSISKVSKAGIVLSSTPIFTSGTYDLNQFDIDEFGNSYVYGRWFDKLNIGGIEYSINTYTSNIIKFNSNGALNYIEPIVQNTFSDNNQKISILPNNKIFISGNTYAQSIKGQTINNSGGDNYYIAELTQSGNLSTKDNSINSGAIKVYPNPAQNFIMIESNEDISMVKIYDLSGKLITNSSIIFNTVEINRLPAGNYIIEIFNKSNNLIGRKKIIKK